jgi:hypothetical protein
MNGGPGSRPDYSMQGFVVEKVALGQVSLQLLWFSKMILIVIFKGTLK